MGLIPIVHGLCPRFHFTSLAYYGYMSYVSINSVSQSVPESGLRIALTLTVLLIFFRSFRMRIFPFHAVKSYSHHCMPLPLSIKRGPPYDRPPGYKMPLLLWPLYWQPPYSRSLDTQIPYG